MDARLIQYAQEHNIDPGEIPGHVFWELIGEPVNPLYTCVFCGGTILTWVGTTTCAYGHGAAWTSGHDNRAAYASVQILMKNQLTRLGYIPPPPNNFYETYDTSGSPNVTCETCITMGRIGMGIYDWKGHQLCAGCIARGFPVPLYPIWPPMVHIAICDKCQSDEPLYQITNDTHWCLSCIKVAHRASWRMPTAVERGA